MTTKKSLTRKLTISFLALLITFGLARASLDSYKLYQQNLSGLQKEALDQASLLSDAYQAKIEEFEYAAQEVTYNLRDIFITSQHDTGSFFTDNSTINNSMIEDVYGSPIYDPQSFVKSQVFKSQDNNVQNLIYHSYTVMEKNFTGIFLISKEGYLAGISRAWSSRLNNHSQGYLLDIFGHYAKINAYKTTPHWSGFGHDPLLDNWSNTLLVPMIIDKNQEGFCGFNLSLENFYSIIQQEIGIAVNNARVLVFKENGTLIFDSSRPWEEIKKNIQISVSRSTPHIAPELNNIIFHLISQQALKGNLFSSLVTPENIAAGTRFLTRERIFFTAYKPVGFFSFGYEDVLPEMLFVWIVVVSIFYFINKIYKKLIIHGLSDLEIFMGHLNRGDWSVELPEPRSKEMQGFSLAIEKYRNFTRDSFDKLHKHIEVQKEEVALSQEKVRLILDSTNDGIFGVDGDDLLRFANQPALQALGYSDLEFLGQKSHLLFHDKKETGDNKIIDNSAENCHICRQQQQGIACRKMEGSFRKKDGSLVEVSYNSIPIRRNYRLVGNVVSFFPVVGARQMLPDFLFIIENTADYFYLIDDKQKLRYCSRAFARLLGKDDWRELAGRALNEIPQIQAFLREAVGSGISGMPGRTDIPERLQFKHVELHKEDGQPYGVLGYSFSPQTDEPSYGRQLPDPAIKNMNFYLYNINHDLENTIEALTNFCAETVSQINRADDTKAKEKLAANQKIIHHVLMLINQSLIAANQQKSPNLKIEKEEFRLSGLLNKLVIFTKAININGCVNLSYQINKVVPENIIGDNSRVFLILANLISEASAVLVESDLFLTVKTVFRSSGQIFLRFDIGGNCEKKIAFSKTHNHEFWATELHLDLLSGKLEVRENDNNQWLSTFDLEFALPENELSGFLRHNKVPIAALAPTQGLSRAILKNKRILVVDDDSVSRDIVVELLKDVEALPESAENGAEALDLLSEKKVDIVLMDVQMPGMDGLEAVKKIRAKSGASYNTIPILAMSAHSAAQKKKQALKAGYTDYLKKPIKPEKLFSTIQRWLSGQGSALDLNHDNQEAENLVEGQSLISIEHGLQMVQNNKNLYLKLLKKFIRDYESSFSKTFEQILEGRYQEATAWLQALRGAAANLGAFPLKSFSENIQQSIMENDKSTIQRQLNEMKSGLAAVIDEIKVFFKQETRW